MRRATVFAAALAASAAIAQAASVTKDQQPAAFRAAPQLQDEALVNASMEDPWIGRALEQIGAVLSESPLTTGAAMARHIMGTPEGEMGHLEASLLSLGAVVDQQPANSTGHHRHHRRGVQGRATANPTLKGHMFGGLPWIFISPVVAGVSVVVLVHAISLWSEFTHTKGATLPGEIGEEM
uniref:Uncharacterized protein n=1 Tax=Alexandrium andersonii TaxID=327968 RepID=A0A7S2MM44_9DINO|mmetsp:Transcript_71717/g.160577  ORF Transcript_71717/g.160577 Transcript_71717/m.160577 type:complete len:181 (+) Transcript_71717:82-624(+)